MKTKIDWEGRFAASLSLIARGYQTPAQMRRAPGRLGLDFHEMLEMAYENIQGEAKAALQGYRRKKPTSLRAESVASHGPAQKEPK